MQPRVSIIVPIYNEQARIEKLIASLQTQSYPAECIQLCLVDNNSTDETRSKILDSGIEPLVEDQIQNADAARNRALAVADGEILAFTDADCVPDSNWIAEGVRSLAKTKADLIAGEISLTPTTQNPTASQLYDMATNLRHDRSVPQRGVAFTANLFVRKAVVDHIGGFKPYCGGDHEFTSDAVYAGYRIEYAPHAIVSHPARDFQELLTKGFRIGREKGIAGTQRKQLPGKLSPRPHFEHLNPNALARSIRRRFRRVSLAKLLLCYGVGCSYIVAGAIGLCRGRLLTRKNNRLPELTTH